MNMMEHTMETNDKTEDTCSKREKKLTEHKNVLHSNKVRLPHFAQVKDPEVL